MPTPRVIFFGPYAAHLDSGELRRDGHKIRLQAQPFNLLVMLLERPGEVVSWDLIRENLWAADTFVDFDHSLGTAINKIRAALNDSAEAPAFVETLPKRGYRFIGEVLSPSRSPSSQPSVELAAQSEASPSPKNQAAATGAGSSTWARRHLVPAVSMALLVLLTIGAYGWRQKSLRAFAPPPIQSVAVLPLENLSNNADEEFFANGLTDELITNLAKISSLRVISRTSVLRYRGMHKPVSQIAKELGVDGIVEGTILRAGGKVRITAQLIQASTDQHLWAEEYERDTQDVLALQAEVARGIAQSIHIRLTPQERSFLAKTPTFDPAVEDLYWKGIYFINRTTPADFNRAREYFEQMLRKDPSSARAWTGVAMAAHHSGMWGNFDGFAPAKTAALKAIALDDSLAEAHAELGMLSLSMIGTLSKPNISFAAPLISMQITLGRMCTMRCCSPIPAAPRRQWKKWNLPGAWIPFPPLRSPSQETSTSQSASTMTPYVLSSSHWRSIPNTRWRICAWLGIGRSRETTRRPSINLDSRTRPNPATPRAETGIATG
jgi:TolB-like protein/DNA-binding winged helix-turn-helix (wHTH) protein